MKITNFKTFIKEEEICADADGNNVAFVCFCCGHPVLIATGLNNWRGRDKEHPVACKGCGARYFLEILKDEEKLYIRCLA